MKRLILRTKKINYKSLLKQLKRIKENSKLGKNRTAADHKRSLDRYGV